MSDMFDDDEFDLHPSDEEEQWNNNDEYETDMCGLTDEDEWSN